jgi:hypothetical protein
MEKTTIIQYVEDETVIQFRWNQSLTVNVYEGIKHNAFENIDFIEIDVFMFADDVSYDEMVESCDEWMDTWASEMLSQERPDGSRF